MQAPLVSIIVPIYNVELYLRECLDSIINQSYINLDIILVDDGSTDNSLDIALEYASKDSRILVISKPNGGSSSARNMGLEFIKGTKLREYLEGEKNDINYIVSYLKTNSFDKTTKNISKSIIDNYFKTCSSNFIKTTLADSTKLIIQELPNNIIHFVDSDDYIMLDCIKKCIDEILQKKLEICIHWQVEMYEQKGLRTHTVPPKWGLKKIQFMHCDRGVDFIVKNNLKNFSCASQAAFQTKILNRYILRFTYAVYYEDVDFSFILLALANKVFMLDCECYIYRCTEYSNIRKIDHYSILPNYLKPLEGFFTDYSSLKAYYLEYSYCIVALNLYYFYKNKYISDSKIINHITKVAKFYTYKYIKYYFNYNYLPYNKSLLYEIWGGVIAVYSIRIFYIVRYYCRHPKKIIFRRYK